MKIRQDHARFKQIVRGRIKSDLRKYMSSGELLGKQGDRAVKIPIHRIDVPRFRHGQADGGGTGQGQGDPGDPVQGDPQDGDGHGHGKAGEGEGSKELELDVTLEELAEIMAEQLELPNIQPRGTRNIKAASAKYSSIRPVGPESLRSFKRTFKQAIRRMVSSGEYNPSNPIIVPRREDKRYRSWKEEEQPTTNAVIVYMMDVSGSMGDEQKEIVRIESFWLDTWLRTQYRGIESRYIVHDASAREVDQHTFFHTRESGGTMISSAYRLCLDILRAEYPASEWNIYPFHFSDGDNWSVDDTRQCMALLRDELLPMANMFGYGQVDSPYGSGQFLKDLRDTFGDEPRVVLSEIKNREAIYDSIRTFLGKGM
jgi:sporulation protein YhbH